MRRAVLALMVALTTACTGRQPPPPPDDAPLMFLVVCEKDSVVEVRINAKTADIYTVHIDPNYCSRSTL